MKKRIGWIVLAVILLFGGFCLYMEFRFSHYKFIEPNLTKEEILQEMPEVAISEEDLKMGKEVLDSPKVQEIIKQSEAEGGKMVFLPEKETARLLVKYTEKGQPIGELFAYKGVLYFGFDTTEEKRQTYSFPFSADAPIEKIVSLWEKNWKGEKNVIAMYSDAGGKFSKIAWEYEWFYWLKELMENGYWESEFFEFDREVRAAKKEKNLNEK